MTIVFLDSYTLNPGDLSWDVFHPFGTFITYDRTLPSEVIERAQDAEVIITNKVRLGEAEYAQLPKLKLVLVAATGYDVIDTVAARNHGVCVCNCAGYSSRAVAQMVFAHLLEVCSSVGHYARLNAEEKMWAKSRDFCCWHNPLTELCGKRMAIVGYGNIGREVERLAQAFYMEVYAVSSKPQSQLPESVTKISLEDAVATCDVISLCCPLTKDNERMINAALLSKANPNLIIVNTARGKLIDEPAMADALKENRIKAFCADVLSSEPPALDNPLLSAPRAFITPHIAWATREARGRIIDILVGNLQAFLNGATTNVVN